MDSEVVFWLEPTMEAKLQHAKNVLGEKWVLHPAHAPVKGFYDNRGWPQIDRQTDWVCPRISE